MAYTHDIPFDESNRANRRRINPDVKELRENFIQTKALPKIGDLRFDPNAEDGDGDGLVQDNTPYERPAIIKPSLSKRTGLASATGSTLMTSSGSWTEGLSNREVAEQAVPDNPADFANLMQAYRTLTGRDFKPVDEDLTEDINAMTFEPKKISKLREALTEALDARPAWREQVDKFGMPPIGVIGDKRDFSGRMYSSEAMFIPESSLNTARNSAVVAVMSRPFRSIYSAMTGAPNIEGVKNPLIGDNLDNILVHEWGHFLNYLALTVAPDAKIRTLAEDMYVDDWNMSPSMNEQSPIGRLFKYFSGLERFSNAKQPRPDDERTPFVNSIYATTSPSEFFAELVTGYFSTDKKTRSRINEPALEMMETILGKRGMSSVDKKKVSTGGALVGLSPREIAKRVVPSNKQQAMDLFEEHWRQLATPEQKLLSSEEVLKKIENGFNNEFGNNRGFDNIDFHVSQVGAMRDLVEETLHNNPDFHETVQRLGMPPSFFTSSRYQASE